MIFKTILNVYNIRKLNGLVALPYPLESDQKAILMYIRGEQSIGAVVECSAKKVRNRESKVYEDAGSGSDHSILPEYIRHDSDSDDYRNLDDKVPIKVRNLNI